jgi:FkbM family methyltransferase
LRSIEDTDGRLSLPERAGVDIAVALRLARGAGGEPAALASHAAVGSSTPSGSLSFRSRLKQGLRPVAAAAYRLVKPVVRPVAFRLRAYFVAPIIAELKGQHEEARRLNLGPEALLDQRLAACSLQTVQELQHTRDLLQRRIDSLSSELDALRTLAPQLTRIEQYGYTAARRVALPSGPDEMLVRTVAGYVVCPASDTGLLATLMEGGELEPGTRMLIQRLLRPGDCFVDVGADVGLHTVAAGFALQGRGRIVAFEPFPQICRLLRKTLWINGFGTLADAREAAASDRAGTQSMHAGIAGSHHSHDEPDRSRPPFELRLERIDDAVGPGARVDLMRIGAEAVALDVLAGARATLAANPDIGLIVKCDASHLQRSNRSIEDWLQAFRQLGLDFGLMNPQSGAIEPRTPGELASRPSLDLFFARPGSPTWDRVRGLK